MNRWPMNRLIVQMLLLGTLLLATSRATADDDRRAAAAKKDPVAMVFSLPKGLVLTPKEMEYANSVRSMLEPQLRAALKRVETGTSKEEKLKAAKEVRQVKEQVQAAVNSILQARYAEAMKEAAKRQAEARKKAAAQRQKNNKKRRKNASDSRRATRKGRRVPPATGGWRHPNKVGTFEAGSSGGYREPAWHGRSEGLGSTGDRHAERSL
ncbi:MAG: hypothetical protein HQ567_08245 [Candidatus Nealsonbacteria bacterium]|nr:hypothetical protein [Candidatus Nealsonbacteria bacterium]